MGRIALHINEIHTAAAASLARMKREASPQLTALNLKLDRMVHQAIDRLIIEMAGGSGPLTTLAPLPVLIRRASTERPLEIDAPNPTTS